MGVDVFDTLDESSMKCIRFDVCKFPAADMLPHMDVSSMKCIRFDVCKHFLIHVRDPIDLLNEVHTF